MSKLVPAGESTPVTQGQLNKASRQVDTILATQKRRRRFALAMMSTPVPTVVGWWFAITFALDNGGHSVLSAWLIVFMVVITIFSVSCVFAGGAMVDDVAKLVAAAREEYAELQDRQADEYEAMVIKRLEKADP